MGPTVSREGARGRTPSRGTRPRVVFSPATPQHAAGIRIEPPVSLPKATSASWAPTATAEPLDEPPGTSRASRGLTGVPNHGLIPVTPNASSWRLVLPTTTRAPAASAARVPARQAASAAAGRAPAAMTFEPLVVGTPTMSMRSLIASRRVRPGDRAPGVRPGGQGLEAGDEGGHRWQPGTPGGSGGAAPFPPGGSNRCSIGCAGVGFQNPPVPWRELEAALSGRDPALPLSG